MDTTTLFTLLGNRLGDRADVIPFMGVELAYIQTLELEQHIWLPWFLQEEFVDLVVTPGDMNVPFPAGFLRELEDQSVWKVSEDGSLIPLRKDSRERLLVRYPGMGEVQGYFISGDDIKIFPAPDTTTSLKMSYYKADDLPSVVTENKWLRNATDLVIAKLGYVMAEKYIQNYELAQKFEKDVVVAYDRIYRVNISREEQSRDRGMEA